MLFAKSSDRPAAEPQLVVSHQGRPPGGDLATQYLTIPDAEAAPVILAQPTWLWGAEHGVNAHGVAVGNEKIFTRHPADPVGPGLIGMDLVRLGLERSITADAALEAMVALLEQWGQSGIADAIHAEAYHSSFLISDPRTAWVLETFGATWAARRVTKAHALSNRVSLRTDWEIGSADLAVGQDLDELRDPDRSTASADGRLAATTDAVTSGELDPRAAMSVLRDHGTGPWGSVDTDVQMAPQATGDDGTGVTVCMHAYRDLATTSSMVAMLGADGLQRLWMAPGAPCVAPFLPCAFVDGVPVIPPALSDLALWRQCADLRARAERSSGLLTEVRQVIGPLERDLLAASLSLGGDLDEWSDLCTEASVRSEEAMATLSTAVE